MSTDDTNATRRGSESNDLLGQAPERAGVAWELALLAQTLEFSDDVRAQIQRGADEIERLRGIVPEVLEKLNDELCAENERLRKAAQDVIDFNRTHAHDQYGDANKAESWSCVRVLREALKA